MVGEKWQKHKVFVMEEKKEGTLDIETQRKYRQGGHMKTEAEIFQGTPRTAGNHQSYEETQRDPSLAQREHDAANNSSLDF